MLRFPTYHQSIDHETLVRTIQSTDVDLAMLQQRITDLYLLFEGPLWKEGYERISSSELNRLIEHNQLIGVFDTGVLTGLVRIDLTGKNRLGFSMLSVFDGYREKGLGNLLVDAVEQIAVQLGCRVVYCEILFPQDFSFTPKEILKRWYSKRGYVHVDSIEMGEKYPELKTVMKHRCLLEIFELSFTKQNSEPISPS